MDTRQLRRTVLSDIGFLDVPDHYLREAFGLEVIAVWSADHRLQMLRFGPVVLNPAAKMRLDDYRALLSYYEGLLTRSPNKRDQGHGDLEKAVRAVILGIHKLRQADIKGAIGYWGTARQLVERAEERLGLEHIYVPNWPPVLVS